MRRTFVPLLLLAAALRAAADPPSVEIRGSLEDEAFRKEAAEAVKRGWKAYCELGGVTPAKDSAVILNIWREREEYLKADRELNAGRFANNGGFFSTTSGEAHLLFAPRPEEKYTKRVPLSDRMRSLIVHEASHIFWRRHVGWYDGGPKWALEGIAELCAEREAGGDCSTNLYVSAGLQALKRAADSGRLIPLEDLIDLDASTQADSFLRDLYYRESWALVRWLVETRPAAWKLLVADFATVVNYGDAPARGRTFFRKHIGEPRALQAEWVAWIRGTKGGPWETKFGDWRLDGEVLEGTAYPATGSAILHETELKGDGAIQADAWVQDLANGQADIVLGGWDDRMRNFVKVAFVKSGITALLVLKDDVWTRVAFEQAAIPHLKMETWLRLRVEVAGRRITAFIGENQVLTHVLADEDVRLDGRWGFGNFDSSCRFRKWSVEPK